MKSLQLCTYGVAHTLRPCLPCKKTGQDLKEYLNDDIPATPIYTTQVYRLQLEGCRLAYSCFINRDINLCLKITLFCIS